jgi:hypothetical protein
MKQLLPKSRQNDLVVQQSNKELLMYDLTNNRAFCLNEAAALVWLECDGKTDVSTISEKLSKKLKGNASPEFVKLALGQLANENLLADNDFWLSQTAEVSRRSAIKKIGFGTLLVLPIITAITAPKAIQAASNATCVPPNNTGAISGTVVGYCSLATVAACETYCFTLDSLCQNCLIAPGTTSFYCSTTPCPPGTTFVCVCT